MGIPQVVLGVPGVLDGGSPLLDYLATLRDTHGGVSHLSCDEIDDLVAFLLTID